MHQYLWKVYQYLQKKAGTHGIIYQRIGIDQDEHINMGINPCHLKCEQPSILDKITLRRKDVFKNVHVENPEEILNVSVIDISELVKITEPTGAAERWTGQLMDFESTVSGSETEANMLEFKEPIERKKSLFFKFACFQHPGESAVGFTFS